MPRLGCWNIHASLLPRWRGAAPVQRAIMAGDTKTGIAIMQMEAGLDTGPVLQSHETPITANDTSESLHARLADLGARAITEAMAGADDKRPCRNPMMGFAMPIKLTRPRRALTGAAGACGWLPYSRPVTISRRLV